MMEIEYQKKDNPKDTRDERTILAEDRGDNKKECVQNHSVRLVPQDKHSKKELF